MEDEMIKKPKFNEGDKVWFFAFGLDSVGIVKEVIWNAAHDSWQYRIEDVPAIISEERMRPAELLAQLVHKARLEITRKEFGDEGVIESLNPA